MRLKITLRNKTPGLLPFNYYYPLSAAVYKLLRFGSPEFASFLHDMGYNHYGKKYKLFTFALRFEKYKSEKSFIRLQSDNAYLYITSPLVDKFIQNFVVGTFESQNIEIGVNGSKTVFSISQVESLPEIEFKNEMKFRLLSPMVLSTKREMNSKLMPYYFRCNDDPAEMNRVFANNLKNKFMLLTGNSAEGKEISFEWDTEYIRLVESKGKRTTRKETIKEGTPEQTEVIGNLVPFIVRGDVELIKAGYECGYGEKNSLGFGFAEAD